MEDDDTVFTRADSLASRTKRDAEDVKKLVTQRKRFDVCRLKSNLTGEAECEEIPLVSLATKDTAPSDVANDILTAEERGRESVIRNVK